MTAWDAVARSRAYLTCSSSMPHLFFRGLFAGEGRAEGGSGTEQPDWSLPSIGSTRARPRSRTTASTKAVRRLRSGWNNGHEQLLSVLSWTAVLSRAVRME